MTSSTKLQQEKSIAVSVLESRCSCDFERLLLEAIDEGLSSLEDSSKQAIYSCLEKNFTIEKQDIPNKIEEFTNAIEEILGYGAKVLEIEIMKHLFAKIGSGFEYFPKKNDLLFVEYIYTARIYVRACCH